MYVGKWALCAGLTIAALGAGAWFAIGSVYSDVEAKSLIGSLSSAGLYLGSAIATASASTLALMLTLIGLTKRSDSDFDDSVYVRISRVSVLSTASLVASVILLMLLVFPVGEFDNLPGNWFPSIYNTVFIMLSLVCALFVAAVIELFITIRRVISAITPGDDVQ